MKHLFKQPFFYTSIASLIALGLIISSYVFGWVTPTANPPSSNLPAPINVSSVEQTKAGNLIIEGVFRLGQFATAPSGTKGALYYNTAQDKVKVYSGSAWSDLGGGASGQLPLYTTAQRDALSTSTGLMIYNTTENKVQVYAQTAWQIVSTKLALAATCTLDGDCDSTHCVDGYCCDTACTGNCNRCNVTGSLGICTNVASDCTGNCDVCSSGNCIADASLCTGNCDECIGSGTSYNCAASNALCSNTDSSCGCAGSGTSFNCFSCTCTACSNYSCSGSAYTTDWGAGAYNCAAGATTDPNRCYNGVCANCGGWGNAGYCWYDGVENTTCTAICAAHGGVYKGTCDWVNDPTDCSTCLHYFPGYICGGAWTIGPAYAASYCFYHQAGSNLCDNAPGIGGYRMCACNL